MTNEFCSTFLIIIGVITCLCFVFILLLSIYYSYALVKNKYNRLSNISERETFYKLLSNCSEWSDTKKETYFEVKDNWGKLSYYKLFLSNFLVQYVDNYTYSFTNSGLIKSNDKVKVNIENSLECNFISQIKYNDVKSIDKPDPESLEIIHINLQW